MPACDDPRVLGVISDRFSQYETIFWNGELGIAGYQRVREISLRGNGLDYIPRRYCIARAHGGPAAGPAYVKPEQTVIYTIAWKPTSSARASAWNGASSASTASLPTRRPARC